MPNTAHNDEPLAAPAAPLATPVHPVGNDAWQAGGGLRYAFHFWWGVAVMALLVGNLVCSGWLAYSLTRPADHAVSHQQLVGCAEVAQAGYDEMAVALGSDSLGWFMPVTDEIQRDRVLRAVSRADDKLVEAWRCYDDIDGADTARNQIDAARVLLADAALLYESIALHEPIPDWYLLKLGVNITN